MDHPFLLNFPHRCPVIIVNKGQRLRIGPQTGLVTAGGDGQPQGLMRTIVIIDHAPLAQGVLKMCGILPLALGQDFTRQVRYNRSSFPMV